MSPQGEQRGGEEEFEAEHVHGVYQQIASHFSSTRYKPWPIVAAFLESLPPGSVGIDAGCGNGKYLPVNTSVFILASDRSESLVEIAQQHQPHDAMNADLLHLPHPNCRFDFAISIAAVHHLSTRLRRLEALRSLLNLLDHKRGKLLVFVWALEQKDSRRGWKDGDNQDVLVPWIMAAKPNPTTQIGKSDLDKQEKNSRTFHRYYHLYRKGELEQDMTEAGATVVDSGYEKDNWWAIAEPQTLAS